MAARSAAARPIVRPVSIDNEYLTAPRDDESEAPYDYITHDYVSIRESPLKPSNSPVDYSRKKDGAIYLKSNVKSGPRNAELQNRRQGSKGQGEGAIDRNYKQKPRNGRQKTEGRKGQEVGKDQTKAKTERQKNQNNQQKGTHEKHRTHGNNGQKGPNERQKPPTSIKSQDTTISLGYGYITPISSEAYDDIECTKDLPISNQYLTVDYNYPSSYDEVNEKSKKKKEGHSESEGSYQEPHMYESLDPSTLDKHHSSPPRQLERKKKKKKKEKESGCHCRNPPCWRWTLVVILAFMAGVAVTIVLALFLTQNTSDDEGSTTTTTTTPTPRLLPTTATPILPYLTQHLLLECPVQGEMDDICWMDSETLIATQYRAKKLLKYTVNLADQNCHLENEITLDFKPQDLVCSPNDGRFYVMDISNQLVVIYNDIQNFSKFHIWNLDQYASSSVIATNQDLIAIGSSGVKPILYIFDKDRRYLYNLADDTPFNQFQLYRMYLTHSGMLLASARDDHRVIIRNTRTNTTVTIGGMRSDAPGRLASPVGVSEGPVDGSILISEEGNDRISVFTEEGHFSQLLDLEQDFATFPPRHLSLLNDGYHNGDSVLAVSSLDKIQMYTLHG